MKEELEEQFKKKLFDALEETNEFISKSIIFLNMAMKNFEIPNTNISNCTIVTNNKLVELSQEFKRSNLSFFAEYDEQMDRYIISVIGEAIISDLTDQMSKSAIKLSDLYNSVVSISISKANQLDNWNKMSDFKKLIFHNKRPDLSLTNAEKEIIKNYLQEYETAIDKIWNYNLKNDVVDSIFKYFDNYYDANNFLYTKLLLGPDRDVVEYLMQERIIPTLKKLNLESLVPDVQKYIENNTKKLKLL